MANEPSITFDVAKVNLNGNCEYTEIIESRHVRSVRPKDYPFIDVDEYNAKKVAQHSWVIDTEKFKKCNLMVDNLYKEPEIQQGTLFRTTWRKKALNIQVFAQDVPPPSVNPQGKFKDRFEYQVVPKVIGLPGDTILNSTNIRNADLLRCNGETRFFSFQIMFDSAYELPDVYGPPNADGTEKSRFAMHFQCHQKGGEQPPFSMRIKSSKYTGGPLDPIFAEFNILEGRKDEDDTSAVTTELFGDIINKVTGERRGLPLQRNVWYQFIFELTPRTRLLNGVVQKPAPLKIWLNKELIYNNKVFWGYPLLTKDIKDPDTKRIIGQEELIDTNQISIKIGTYRGRHNRTQNIYLKNAYFGDTLKAVNRT